MIVVNGQRFELRLGETVTDVLARMGIAEGARGVAVAVDGEVVPRAAWSRAQSCSTDFRRSHQRRCSQNPVLTQLL